MQLQEMIGFEDWKGRKLPQTGIGLKIHSSIFLTARAVGDKIHCFFV